LTEEQSVKELKQRKTVTNLCLQTHINSTYFEEDRDLLDFKKHINAKETTETTKKTPHPIALRTGIERPEDKGTCRAFTVSVTEDDGGEDSLSFDTKSPEPGGEINESRLELTKHIFFLFKIKDVLLAGNDPGRVKLK